MTDKIKNSQLRKMVFNNIDENKNGKIDSSETKLGNIFNLKEGDKKIKRKDFDRSLAINFLDARKDNLKISHKKHLDGDVKIQTCYQCDITEKDAGVDIMGENNKAIVQHGDNHVAEINGNDVEVTLPKNNNDSINEIGLCIECNVDIKDESINIEGKGNTLVYQNDQRTQIIDNNKNDVHIKIKNEVTIEDCQDCTKENVDNHTTIEGNDNNAITQFGDNNKADIKK